MDTTPKWYDPCGTGVANSALGDAKNTSNEDTTAVDLINKIVSQARIAEGRATSFTEKFLQAAGFKMDWLAAQDYTWLPTNNMKKKWKQNVPEEDLENLKYEPTLLSVYTDLQKIAVGIEQIVWDEADRKKAEQQGLQEGSNDIFFDEFYESQSQLNILLCEIHSAILEKGLKFGENVSREIMGPEFRQQSNKTNMFLRNWIIYRDYMNMLEYVIEVFEHIGAKLSRHMSRN